jgi:tetratricopeptide (TPR) repeat protein
MAMTPSHGQARAFSNPDDNTVNDLSAATSADLGPPSSSNLEAILEVGTVLAGRYQILQMLGLGGMGAVYKAQDKELDRVIALKVIRPEIARHPEALARFRQELLTARQVTHKNVVRIFDIGESDGIKFITMEFVAGRDLRSILEERGQLPPTEAIAIMRQVCAALAAAHAENVIHRDLKPGNVMRDEQGRIVVMDFGLARTVDDSANMTRTGAIVGTVEYMSPEQALAGKLDARSDLFTIGLIFYELLTGKIPYKADSALASLIKRTQERAIPAAELDSTIPKALSDILSKCLERDPGQRYQTAQEIIDRLDEFEGRRPSSIQVQAPRVPDKKWMLIAAGLVVVAVVAAGIIFHLRSRGVPRQAQKPISVLLADFSNTTSDEVFDGTLEPAFALALEGAPFISSYNRSQARKEAGLIKAGGTLDEANSKLLAVRNGINVVITGSIAKQGEGYVLSCRALDADTGKTIVSEKTEASDKSSVLKAVGALAGAIRTGLGDSTPESVKMAQQETYTTASVEAAHEYARAQELRYAGKTQDAIKGYTRATELDPKFGTAYAGLAAMYANLGQREEATKYYKLALTHADRMTDREKYRTRGGYYLATLDAHHAIEEFTALTQAYPADNMGYSALAFAYYLRRDMTKAMEQGRKALEIYPKNVPYRNNVALYALYASDFSTAAKEASEALSQNPSYIKAYITLGLAQIGLGKADQALETYRKLEQVGPVGASFAASGMADLALYQGQYAEAASLLTKSIAADLARQSKEAAAKKTVLLAEAQFAGGDRAAAGQSVVKALSISKESVLYPAARMLVELGQYPKASALADELASQLGPVPQSQAKLIAGEIALKQGKAAQAVQALQGAIAISDLWLARFDLARAYLDSQAYPQADSEFDRCVKRQGEASDAFLDEMPTFHYFPPVYYFIARVREGEGSASGAGDMFKTFLALRGKASKDALVQDAQKRMK